MNVISMMTSYVMMGMSQRSAYENNSARHTLHKIL